MLKLIHVVLALLVCDWTFRTYTSLSKPKPVTIVEESAVSPCKTPAPTPLVANKSQTWCKNMQDIYPGKMVGTGRWVPDNCRLRELSYKEQAQCLGKNGFYTITDSLGRFIFEKLTEQYEAASKKHPYLNGPAKAVEYCWNPSSSSPYGFLAAGRNTKEYMMNASLVLLVNGVWDIGVHSCSPEHYFEFLRLKVLRYRKEMSSTGTMVLYNIPYIHHKVTKNNWGVLCNAANRVAVHREVLKLVSACTGVGILDTYQMQKQYPNETHDGIHMSDRGNNAISGIVYNMMCPSKEMRLKPYHPELSCTDKAIAEAKARWATVPEANGHPEGCPTAKHHKCFDSEKEFQERVITL
eukprot:TRINITY_DN7412_c0_g1_i3.p1 TRINITY_DN7412_c0_g1~~TRINITY_DN7412_c0_g1_i3.p1  ORF type:complete len:370 (+),score=101.62 TRINITY_DN7412_c0_g1_i3:56-1111(+)